jgi:hypothetical protein
MKGWTMPYEWLNGNIIELDLGFVAMELMKPEGFWEIYELP